MPIHPGTFMMGSENGGLDEWPQTEVTLSMPYWLGKTQVTQAQWEAIMGTIFSTFTGPTLPVESVSWDEAMAFCAALTRREEAAGRLPAGYEYTLPTEAQWEYACRAGTSGDYAGDMDAMAWYIQNSGYKTHPVATKQANAWGLYDMHGNVWEWCRDRVGDYPGDSVTDPNGPASGSCRIFRGGCWSYAAAHCSSTHRSKGERGFRLGDLGFRLALAPKVEQ
jgi:formylglycine-generating enzyme required for sulfatase activity